MRIQRKDAFQIFLNPHQSLTQPGTQSPRRDSGVDIDFTLSDDPDSAIEHVSSLRKKMRENAAELQRLNKRLEQLRRNLLSANKERDELDDQHDLLQAQHADLKSTRTTHENGRRKVERSVAVLQKKHGVAESAEQTWSESCKTAQRDARKARKAKEERECKRA